MDRIARLLELQAVPAPESVDDRIARLSAELDADVAAYEESSGFAGPRTRHAAWEAIRTKTEQLSALRASTFKSDRMAPAPSPAARREDPIAQPAQRAFVARGGDVVTSAGIVLWLRGRIGPGKGIDDISRSYIKRALARHPQAPLTVMLDSRGGSTILADAIGDLIRSHAGATCCIGLNNIKSAAMRIMIAADDRRCNAACQFLVHPVEHAAPDGRQTASWHRQRAAELEANDDQFIEHLHRRTGARRDTLEALKSGEHYFGAELAKQLGLVHRIVGVAA